jgi:hypothetical protein
MDIEVTQARRIYYESKYFLKPAFRIQNSESSNPKSEITNMDVSIAKPAF